MLSSLGLWLVNTRPCWPLIGLKWDTDDPMITGPEAGPELMRCERWADQYFQFSCHDELRSLRHTWRCSWHITPLTPPNRHHQAIFTNKRVIGIDNCDVGNNIRHWESSLCLSQNIWVCLVFLILISRSSFQRLRTSGIDLSVTGFVNWTRFWDIKQRPFQKL